MRLPLLGLFLLAAAGADYMARIAPVGTGYAAKILCSAVFVSDRAPASVIAAELSVPSGGILRLFSYQIDFEKRRVVAHFFGTNLSWAVWRPGLGCALAFSAADAERLAGERGPQPSTASNRWRQAPRVPALELSLDKAFENPGTRAVLIARDGEILAERYAVGFNAQTPLLGWSMSKTATNALVGIRLNALGADLEAARLLPEWSDARAAISAGDLLRMRSGLRFREVYAAGPSDVTRMLFTRRDASGFAAAMPLERLPGAHWSYSSGSSNILMRLLRSSFRTEDEYRSFPRDALFDPIGARSAVFETDAFGTFVGSSFMYASARDWARLGRLYLNDGVWEGRRVLPAGWVERSVRPSGGGYGAHLWVDLPPDVGGPEDAAWSDAFHFLGHEGQAVSVIPSRGLVALRLGLNKSGTWDHAAFLRTVLAAVESPAPKRE